MSLDISKIYGSGVIPHTIDSEVAARCAAQLSVTHQQIGGITMWNNETIEQMLRADRHNDPFGSKEDAIVGPCIDSQKQTVFSGQFIGLWKPIKTE